MKPSFQCEPNPTVEQLRHEIERMVSRMGEGVVTRHLLRKFVSNEGTTLAHGFEGKPLGWRIFNQEGDARVWQTAPADAHNLYLMADSGVTVSIEVF